MSSGSNLSWCTADNEPNESIQFLDEQSEKGRNLKVAYAVSSEFKTKKSNVFTQNDRNVRESVVEAQRKTETTTCCCCCRKSLQIVHRIKGLYTLKMPWIIVLLSIIQVCMLQRLKLYSKFTFVINLVQFLFHIR